MSSEEQIRVVSRLTTGILVGPKVFNFYTKGGTALLNAIGPKVCSTITKLGEMGQDLLPPLGPSAILPDGVAIPFSATAP